MKKLLTAKWNFYLHFQWSIIYMESIYIGKLHHLFSGGLLTDGHEEGGLI